MRRITRVALFLVVAAGLTACGGPRIDDAMVAKYIQAYKGLKKASPKLAADLQKNQDAASAGLAGFTAAEKVIKDAGFSGYPEFVQANAAIGMAFSQVQAGSFMAEMDKMQKSGGAQLAAVLKDPNVPEAVKAQLRTQQQNVQQTYAQNKGWADLVMGWVGKANDKETLAVVQRHRQALQAAFTAK